MSSDHNLSGVEALVDEAKQNKKIQGPVYVMVTLPKPPVRERQHEPILIPLPHRTRRTDELSVCLVVKDPAHKIFNKVQEEDTLRPLFDEVIGVGKLRRRLKGSKQRIDEFAKSFNVLLVQDKVATPLKEALGLHFYKTSRHLPMVITLGESGEFDPPKIRYQAKLAMKSAQLILKPTPQVMVMAGNTKMDADKLKDNVNTIVKFCIKKLDTGAKFYVKTPESVALPL